MRSNVLEGSNGTLEGSNGTLEGSNGTLEGSTTTTNTNNTTNTNTNINTNINNKLSFCILSIERIFAEGLLATVIPVTLIRSKLMNRLKKRVDKIRDETVKTDKELKTQIAFARRDRQTRRDESTRHYQ